MRSAIDIPRFLGVSCARGTLDERRCPVNGSKGETTCSSRQTFEGSESRFQRSLESRISHISIPEVVSSAKDEEDSRFRARKKEGRIKQSLSDRVQSSRSRQKLGSFDRPRFKFTFSEKLRRSDKVENLDSPASTFSSQESKEEVRSKLQKSDSFLKKFVRSSKDNITEGCERLVRNIQKSPLVLRKKFLSGNSCDGLNNAKGEEKPVPPIRRKRSEKKSFELDQNRTLSTDSNPKGSTNNLFINCPSTETNTDSVLPTKSLQLQENNHGGPANEAVSKSLLVAQNHRLHDDEDSSKSVSVEDVEDLIRSEDNLRLLEQRVLVRRRLEKSTKLLEALHSSQRRSWSEESLIRQVHSRFRAEFPVPRESTDPVAANCSPITHRRYVRARGDREDRRSVEARSPEEETPKVRWQTLKAKRSPPPDDSLDQRSTGIQWTADNRHGSADKRVSARKWWIRSEELHARQLATLSDVKCKLANFADARQQDGGDEEGSRDHESAERQSKHELVPRHADSSSSLVDSIAPDPAKLVHGPEDSSRVCSNVEIDTNSLSPANDDRIIEVVSSSHNARQSKTESDSEVTTVLVNASNSVSHEIADSTFGEVSLEATAAVLKTNTAVQPESYPILVNQVPKKPASRSQGKSPRKKKLKFTQCQRIQDSSDWKMKFPIRLMRIRDKLMLGLSAFAILFTILLVVDLQMDLGYSGHHLVPSHGRVRMGEDPNTDTIYNNFRRKFLQRMNASKEQSSGDVPGTTQNSGKVASDRPRDSRTEKAVVHDRFPDLVDIVVKGYGVSAYDGVARISGEDHAFNPTLAHIKKINPK